MTLLCHSSMYAASTTKVFTATAVMQLVEQGKLDLDDPLVKYLPEFAMQSHDATSSDQITIRQLLTHHAGLPSDYFKGSYLSSLEAWSAHKDSYLSLPQELRNEYVSSPPEHVVSYSNLGFALLGALIDRVSGQSYSDYLQANVLDVAGMSGSTFELDSGVLAKTAQGYRDGRKVAFIYPAGISDGGLITNGHGFARFIQAYLDPHNETLLTNQAKQTMFTRQNSDIARDFDFQIGLSWFLDDFGFANLGTLAFHHGNEAGFTALLVLAPQENMGVALLTNTENANGALLSIAAETLKVVFEATTGTQVAYHTAPQKIALSDQELDVLAGEYVGESLGFFTVQRHKSTLRATAFGKSYTLTPYENGRFGISFRMFGIIPVTLPMEIAFRSVDGDMVVITYAQGFATGSGKRIARAAPSVIWRAREGKYELINGEDDMLDTLTWFNVRDDRGLLHVETEESGLPLTLIAIPQTRDYALTAGLGRRAGETMWFEEKEGSSYLTYSGYIYRRMNR